ncbi:MAG: hypothetical protein ACOX4Q_05850 [Syntrophomonadales bacterium]
MRSILNEEEKSGKLKLKVRFDYKGWAKQNRFPFKSKSVEEVAEQTRDQQVALLRNVPVQGIRIDDIIMGGEVYTVYDEIRGVTIGYAPVWIEFTADSIEDAVHFIMKEEFRKVEIVEPDQLSLSKIDIERLLFKVNEELKAYKAYLDKKLEYWK